MQTALCRVPRPFVADARMAARASPTLRAVRPARMSSLAARAALKVGDKLPTFELPTDTPGVKISSKVGLCWASQSPVHQCHATITEWDVPCC